MRCVDSTFVIDLLRSVPSAVAKASELDREGQVIAIPAPCLAEIIRGAHSSGRREIRLTEELLAQLEVLPLDVRSARGAGMISVECAARGKEVPLLDCLIAGIVRDHRLTLITRDADFARIPGLPIETY